jgi:hypothetical protein
MRPQQPLIQLVAGGVCDADSVRAISGLKSALTLVAALL